MQVIALNTGGNRGLGLATASALAERGVHVIVGARTEESGKDAADALRAIGASADSVVIDVDDPVSVRAAARHITDVHGRLDVLINNAGILPEASADPVEVVDAELFRRTFATNVFGAVSTIEAFLPLLRTSGGARIINVSSTMGSLADQNDPASPYYDTVVPAYQASKAALNSLTIGLAKLLSDTNIVVTSVCPGFVQTDLAPTSREDAPLTADQAAVVVAEAALAPAGTPSGRFVDTAGEVPW